MNPEQRFLVFFFDPKKERPDRLAAVSPLFTTPSAINILVKTAKFGECESLVVTGEKGDIARLVTKVERLDVTDWMHLEKWDLIRKQITDLVESIEGLSVFDLPKSESIVLGGVSASLS